MTMLVEGLNRVRDLFNTNTDQGQFGTGTTAEAVTDVALQTPITATLLSTTSSTARQFLVKTTTVSSVLANGSTITEHGLIKSSTSDLISRQTFTGLAKTNSINMRANVRYFFK